MLDIKITGPDSSPNIVCNGKIDEAGAEKMKHCFFELNVKALQAVTFDFKEVSYVGSACIGKLLLFYKEIGDAGGTMKIININESVLELFKVVRLDTILDIST